ncbi:MAG: CDP-alcohol phosphatidyltransferase family protein [Mariniphaga sp.]|nr:CDP-alcohol phosphatidyltransferase family protein [Mariniphaga sp.]MDD4425086.1 CDP-alcohol phosphatidyltransferase family protein [Mariniphaga sp.]
MKQIIKHIPNFITSLNLMAGSLAVIFAIDGHLIWAGIFICIAAVFDFLDGMAARLLNAYSETGKQLDSLSDLISFGLAPAAILFTLLEFSLFEINQPVHVIAASWQQWLILFSALLMPVCGAFRLARFNANQSDIPYFRGLPIPANGLFWASLGLMLEIPKHQEIFLMIFSTKNLFLLGIFTSVMMVISLPMFSLKLKNFSFQENWYRYLFLFIAILLFLFFQVYGLAMVIIAYILLNFLFYLLKVKYI